MNELKGKPDLLVYLRAEVIAANTNNLLTTMVDDYKSQVRKHSVDDTLNCLGELIQSGDLSVKDWSVSKS